MTFYEYDVVRVPIKQDFKDYLNAAAEDGWELVTFMHVREAEIPSLDGLDLTRHGFPMPAYHHFRECVFRRPKSALVDPPHGLNTLSEDDRNPFYRG